MSDLDLLMAGCVVTFIGVAGAYVYIRESFTAVGMEPQEPVTGDTDEAQEVS